MGRPLKISKYAKEAGIIDPTSASPFVASDVPVDQAYPPFASLEDSNPPAPGVRYVGVVGGQTGLNTTPPVGPTYPVVLVTANIQKPDGTSAATGAASILRQKGARKYMVALNAAPVATNTLIPGVSYQIVTVTVANWSSVGGGRYVNPGEIFTATAAVAGLGTVRMVGTCVLTDAAPAPGQMTITYTINGGASQYLSKLTNKWFYDFVAGQTGADIWNWDFIQQDTRYAANYFDDTLGVVEAKSGTAYNAPNTPTQQNEVQLGIVDNQA